MYVVNEFYSASFRNQVMHVWSTLPQTYVSIVWWEIWSFPFDISEIEFYDTFEFTGNFRYNALRVSLLFWSSLCIKLYIVLNGESA